MKSSVAVDKDGTEVFGATPLVRYNDYWISKKWFKMAQLPKGTIKKL